MINNSSKIKNLQINKTKIFNKLTKMNMNMLLNYRLKHCLYILIYSRNAYNWAKSKRSFKIAIC